MEFKSTFPRSERHRVVDFVGEEILERCSYIINSYEGNRLRAKGLIEVLGKILHSAENRSLDDDIEYLEKLYLKIPCPYSNAGKVVGRWEVNLGSGYIMVIDCGSNGLVQICFKGVGEIIVPTEAVDGF